MTIYDVLRIDLERLDDFEHRLRVGALRDESYGQHFALWRMATIELWAPSGGGAVDLVDEQVFVDFGGDVNSMEWL